MNAAAADSDRLTRFLLDRAGVRGVRVHLGDSWTQIRERDDYPLAVAELLGEATAAAALFTGHAKVDGRLSVQLRGEGRLRTLFTECTAAGTLRGIARLAEDDASPVSRDLRELGPGAMLAITIENRGAAGREPLRYQGVVALEADDLATAFEQYFRQSEQLPTRLLLAADAGHAAGLMLQKLPGDEGDEDGWNRASALFDTLRPDELLQWPAETLLTRLFHEEGVRLLGDKPLRFACSCSQGRVAAMLQSLGRDQARAAVIGGSAHVRCEFCGQAYRFTAEEVEGLFSQAGPEAPAPGALQ
ncbi:MAG TPA: Hsp33 family molecular chaperone HslO [Luteimonas sp.]